MSERSVEHVTFAIERTYGVPPARAFAAWADPDAKAGWFNGPDQQLELDFRVGGRERSWGTGPDGNPFAYDAVYRDIVPGERIVYAYDMFLGDTRISVSLATVEFRPDGEGGTRLVFTEQCAFLDGHELADRREHGMAALLDALGAELEAGARAD